MSVKAHLLITPQEALVIDACLKGEAFLFEEHKGLLARLGYCITKQKSRVIDLDEDTLWFLRAHLTLGVRIGAADSSELLCRVYAELLQIIKERYFVADYQEVEQYDDKNYSGEIPPASAPTSTSQDGTACGPSEAVEPGPAVSWAEGGYNEAD